VDKTNKVVIKVGGEAGLGIMSFADWVGRLAGDSGLWAFQYPEYPSLIRGGNNTQKITVSDEEMFSTPYAVDLLICFDRNTYDLSKRELKKESLVIGWEEDLKEITNAVLVPSQLKKKIFLKNQNSFFYGVVTAALGLDKSISKLILKEAFPKKDGVRDDNLSAFGLGYEWYFTLSRDTVAAFALDPEKKELLSGNEAISMGAVEAGCGFAAIYPMTPISGILHKLIALRGETEMIVFQPEDEISGVVSAIGASFTGARSMVATSGGGFCLMTEGVGMAGMSETPLVIVEGQRTGPSTGMPTWTEQADLNFMINSSHSEFPRIVLAPGDIQECFKLTYLAFWLAEKYQLPVIVMTDKFLSESKKTIQTDSLKTPKVKWPELIKHEKNYKRYKLTDSGISPRAFPGKNLVVANSYEHDEHGYFDDSISVRNAQMKKRLEKVKGFELEDGVRLYGDKNADLTLVGWGSTKGVIMEALKWLNNVNFIHFSQVYPLPSKGKKLLKSARNLAVVENNFTGQLRDLIKKNYFVNIEKTYLKNDGRPFWTEEILKFCSEEINGKV
jgi:2-oxoglutarate ferredoxin oxidoreductase subunit alpha